MKDSKKYMFQYVYDNGVHNSFCSISDMKIIEDTQLITLEEANRLWEKYYPEVVKRLQNNERPEMVIWQECDNETDYSNTLKEIDWRDDLEVENGKIYKKNRVEIKD